MLLSLFSPRETARALQDKIDVALFGDSLVIRDAARLLGVEDLLCLPGVSS